MDEQANGWRGEISTRVVTLERQQQQASDRLDRVTSDTSNTRADLAVIRVRQGDQGEDLKRIMATLEKGRTQDLLDLQKTIERSRDATRNMLLYLLAPLFVLVVGGLILFFATGSAHPVVPH